MMRSVCDFCAGVNKVRSRTPRNRFPFRLGPESTRSRSQGRRSALVPGAAAPGLLGASENGTLRVETMKSLHFRAFLAILWLVFTLSAGAQSTAAQTPATPPATLPTAPPLFEAPSAGRKPEMAQPTKMMPTGIGAYGGSIEHDLYTNSTYGFSFKIPPGRVVVPVKTNLEKTAPRQRAGKPPSENRCRPDCHRERAAEDPKPAPSH